jgi:hypothetical protein
MPENNPRQPNRGPEQAAGSPFTGAQPVGGVQPIGGQQQTGQHGASRLGGAFEETGTAVAEKAQEAWDATKQQASRMAANVSATASNVFEDVTALIRRYPIAAIGAGFALGCLVACALPRGDYVSRRMSESPSI